MSDGASTAGAQAMSEDIRFRAATSGSLLACSALPLTYSVETAAPASFGTGWSQLSAMGGALLLLVASLSIVRHPALGRALAGVAVLGLLVVMVPQLLASPLTAFAALVLATTALWLLMRQESPRLEPASDERSALAEGRARGAAGVALILWATWSVVAGDRWLLGMLAVGWALICAMALSVGWALRQFRRQRRRALAVLIGVGVATALAIRLWGSWPWLVSALAIAAVVSSAAIRAPPRRELQQSGGWELFAGQPERYLVGTFAALCLLGTVLLALPLSSVAAGSIGITDALFTATSAVCVTGLIVLDTPTAFTTFGQIVILLLIQIGGLGIMAFYTVAFGVLGQRMSLRHEGIVASLISTHDRGRLHASAKRILGMTLVAEGCGALLLAVAFWAHGDSPGMALWRGVFTSISAFCNAGFALQTDSLIPYQDAPLVLHTVGVLIVVGGLSPLVVFALPRLVLRRSAPVSAQARLSLAAAAVLLFGGFVWYLAFEWNDSLRELSLPARIHNAWFQSITLRTAGFNSVDITQVAPATLTLMLLWMFIGGSPGGTAGGVKTTTISLLVLSVVQAVRGHWTLQVFGRRIPERTLGKAAVVVTIAVTSGLLALVAILLTQDMPTHMATFEVVSALGTVGLSIGGTAALDGIGKAVIIVCMFAGRVGGMSLLLFLSSRRASLELGRPEEDVDVG